MHALTRSRRWLARRVERARACTHRWLTAACLTGVTLQAGAGAAAPDERFVTYLTQHAQALDLQDPRPRWDDDFLSGRLFIVGEVHGIADGQLIDLALLRALHRQAGVRTYLGEFDFVQASAFNRFLDSGRLDLLKPVFDAWRQRGLQWASRDFHRKLVEIRAWNRSLPASQRIRFVGADEVHDMPSACRYLAQRVPARPATEAGRALRQRVTSADCTQPGSLARAASDALRAQDAALARAGLGPALQALAVEAAHADRSERMAAHAMRYFSRADAAPAYGLWGIAHAVQAQVNGEAPLALRLLQQGIAVRSLLIMNVRARMMIPEQQAGGEISYGELPYTLDSADAVLLNGIEDLKAAAVARVTLFNLQAPGSPYAGHAALTRAGGRWGEAQPFSIDVRTAGPRGWVQSVILSSGSAATQAWP